jgi:hypothetical protein
MAEQQEHWYDANDVDDRQAFYADLLNVFRRDHPGEGFGANLPRLWQLIEAHGGSLDGRATWLRIVSEMIDKDTVEVRQKQDDASDRFFSLDAAETRSLVQP